jgi:hypothetical protein
VRAGGGRCTEFIAFPDEAGVVSQALLDVAIEAVVAEISDRSLVPFHVDGAFREIEVVGDVILLPLQEP